MLQPGLWGLMITKWALLSNKRNLFDSHKKTRHDLFQVFTCIPTTAVQLQVDDKLIDQSEKFTHFQQTAILDLYLKLAFRFPVSDVGKQTKMMQFQWVESNPVQFVQSTLRVFVGAMLTRSSTGLDRAPGHNEAGRHTLANRDTETANLTKDENLKTCVPCHTLSKKWSRQKA